MEEITVCVITWNGAKFIERQLKSILNQSLLPKEIVLVDDCSDDGTFEICKDILLKFSGEVIVLRNQRRSGVNFTISRAVENANCNIIVLSDQDDYWYPNRLETIQEQFDFPTVDILTLNADIETNFQKTDVTLRDVRPFSDSILLNVIQNRFVGCQMAINKNFLSKAMPIPLDNLNFYDFYFGMLALLSGKIQNIKEPLGIYCRHSNTASNLNKPRFFFISIVARLKLFQYLLVQIFKIKVLRVFKKNDAISF